MIYGVKPVLEKLKANPDRIRKIEISDNRRDSDSEFIRNTGKQLGIPVVFTNRRELDQRFSSNVNHQGVVAIISIADLISFEELIDQANDEDSPLIAVLEGIQDPGNLGAIIRSAECAGVSGVIFSERNSTDLTDTVVKTSAGAIDNVPLARASNVVTVIEKLKAEGYWVAGADANGETVYTDWGFREKTAIVLGSEGKGLRRLTTERCDVLLSIPLRGTISSLNVSVTAGVIFYEALRQKLGHKSGGK